ncbi:nucleoside hydrolase [Actinopolymorpha sp. B17G11]|uniref:nucleoside hydrolase n=1 Tax=Actinopolymorpha sp. B17G11 TaxID=3160861 RepID=UPI0032E4759E
MANPHRVILDTDIGSDVDDALALAMLFGATDIELLGVTTVYGDVDLRARIARRLARLAGHDGLAVASGAERPLSGAEAWWAGFEGQLYSDLGGEVFMEDVTAAEFLAQTAADIPGELDVVAVGPLTNLAAAIRTDPAFVSNVRRVYVMGGRFDVREQAEHNFKCDAEAAAEVFASGIPVTVVGLEITTRARIGPDELAPIAAAGALGRQIEAEVHQWWQYTEHQWNHPHDPIAVLAMLRPDLLGLTGPVRVRVEPEGDLAGVSVAEPVPVGEGVDTARATYVVDRINVAGAVAATVALIKAAGDLGPS